MAEGHGGIDWSNGGTVLAFMNEVAGGRKLLEAVRARVDAGADRVAVVAPQNQPMSGQIVDRDELRDAARSRVEVTQAVLAEFGIDSQGAIFDPDPPLALDDAIRGFGPSEVLLSCLLDTRFGPARKDLVMWSQSRFEVPVTHIPVRIDDDAVRWDVTHTLVVATQTVASRELIDHLKKLCAERPHRFTIISPPSGALSREEVCERLARTLAELYRAEIDATGQPMSPAPLAAVENAIEHYRVDEILISTLAGEQSKWVSEGLIDDVRSKTDKPLEHFEAGGGGAESAKEAEPVGVTAGPGAGDLTESEDEG
jgi:hypothetical protein